MIYTVSDGGPKRGGGIERARAGGISVLYRATADAEDPNHAIFEISESEMTHAWRWRTSSPGASLTWIVAPSSETHL